MKDCSNLVSNGNIALAVHATFANFHFSGITRTYLLIQPVSSCLTALLQRLRVRMIFLATLRTWRQASRKPEEKLEKLALITKKYYTH